MSKRKSRKKMIDGKVAYRLIQLAIERSDENRDVCVSNREFVKAGTWECNSTGLIVAQNIVRDLLKG